MKIEELEKMWNEFSKIPLVDGKLNEQFYTWDIDTNGVKILSWFNQKLPTGILLQNFSQPQLEMLWDDFSDTPTNDDDEIEEDFYCWEKGTDRLEIWHWFDERLPNGLGIDFNPSA